MSFISLVIASAWLLLAGCNIPKEQITNFNGFYEQGDFSQALEYAQDRLDDNTEPSGNNLLWALQTATCLRAMKDYEQSNLWFDRAEEMLKHFDTTSRELDTVGSTLVNDNIIPYKGWVYDGTMINTYKALNFIALGKDDLARVEFNRALDRQTRAKEKFNAEIQKRKDELAKRQAENQIDYQKTTESSEVQSKIKEAYPHLYDFQAYPDFVNPFSTYLAGVFFTIIGDNAKAEYLLKESAGMMPDNSYVQKELESIGNPITNTSSKVWVFFENGVGPIKEEYRIDLPLFLFTGDVYYAGIALPKLVKRWPACQRLTIQSGSQSVGTEPAGDMERVMQTEFSGQYPWILTRAILATTVKTAGQAVLIHQDSSESKTAAIFLALYSFATTAADVRIWSALPDQFQCAAVEMPSDGRLRIGTGQGWSREILLPACRYAIVYIKMVSLAQEPVIEIFAY